MDWEVPHSRVDKPGDNWGARQTPQPRVPVACIIIKLPKITDKERILKAEREKDTVTYKGAPIRLSADFSKETLHTRKDWKEVLKIMKGKDLHSRLLYPAKLSFRTEGQIKCLGKVKGVYHHLALT